MVCWKIENREVKYEFWPVLIQSAVLGSLDSPLCKLGPYVMSYLQRLQTLLSLGTRQLPIKFRYNRDWKKTRNSFQESLSHHICLIHPEIPLDVNPFLLQRLLTAGVVQVGRCVESVRAIPVETILFFLFFFFFFFFGYCLLYLITTVLMYA